MNTAPPTYEAATFAANPGARDTKPAYTPQPPSQHHVFPPAFGFYHASGSHSDIRISLSAESALLFYIGTHNSLSSQPSIVLNSTPNPASPPLAHATLHTFSSGTDIVIFSPPNPASPSPPHALLKTSFQKSGVFTTAHTFTIPTATGSQTFEWKSSSGAEVHALQGKSHGMKLVTAGGNVVAAWAPPKIGNKKQGKMAFIGGAREELGGVWEVMVVITVLALMERRRRSNNSAGGGAGGGGGGC
ncbi:hypothetical protein LOCC1_G008667 [Lachnellula occidentalis]|uniref:Uncharacterized protein n=1 Tax=Lachnellula occidentalis TaxID=215460 RepID=A0A8H8RIV7_9HELO|nr:hypothetical protein LOCC1_G008667 [Lachnellula occidentalis]